MTMGWEYISDWVKYIMVECRSVANNNAVLIQSKPSQTSEETTPLDKQTLRT